ARVLVTPFFIFFFVHVRAPPHFYTLSLHDALPISLQAERRARGLRVALGQRVMLGEVPLARPFGEGDHRLGEAGAARRLRQFRRSEEHTSELQSRENLVCRLLLEKKKEKDN